MVASASGGEFKLREENSTHLHFYMHDIASNPNPTAIRVVKGPLPLPGLPNFNFGDIFVMDDPLTEGPNLTSKLVGRAQGSYMAASQDSDVALLWTTNLVFKEGKYNGSTLSILSRDAIFAPVRELPVVGGTGIFRLARGYALLKTYSFNTTSGDAVLELDVYVLHH
ncbi:dirigent protein 21 [Cocos nucifera]|uniref:Dirigent protein n=1 Tax=Cocos nucifera TaxID=13894 RepID=A0A8K0N8Q4_COCNU|nr:dirigent protein 21 [Cocos nucifera]